MEKACQLSEKILNDIDTYSDKYVSEEGKVITTEDSVMLLNTILQEGFTLHKYLVEKQIYVGKPELEALCVELQKYMEKLQITAENADKLTLSNAVQIWDQTKLVIAVLACTVLDFKAALN